MYTSPDKRLTAAEHVDVHAAAAAQEEAEDLSAAEEVVAGDMAVGTLVLTHLTPQDLRAMEILLPKQAVEANILPALTYSLLKFKVHPPSIICPHHVAVVREQGWVTSCAGTSPRQQQASLVRCMCLLTGLLHQGEAKRWDTVLLYCVWRVYSCGIQTCSMPVSEPQQAK